MSTTISPTGPLFRDMIEASLNELLNWRQKQLSVKTLDSANTWYLHVLISYLKGDITELHRLVEGTDESIPAHYQSLAETRLKIRLKTVTALELEDMISRIIASECTAEILGEAYFIAGYGSYIINEYSHSQKYYELSEINLNLAGSFKKSMKAAQNKLASLTCERPDLRLIPEYHQLLLKARKLKDLSTCGLCHVNISREYQKIGSLSAGLFHVNQALTYFQYDLGSVHYYLTLTHRAHIYFELGDDEKAILDIERAMICDFAEVHGAIEVLQNIDFQKSEKQPDVRVLHSTWQNRMKNIQAEKNRTVQFTDMESQLIQHLGKGAKTKSELSTLLFGDLIDPLAAENRLKNILVRIRKKDARLIQLTDGRYYINTMTGKVAK